VTRTGPSDKTRNWTGFKVIVTWPNGHQWDFRPSNKKIMRKKRAEYLAKGATVEVQARNKFGAYETVSTHVPETPGQVQEVRG
jgi:hypothetical protein